MPRKSQGVRKWLRERAGRPAVWVILDGTREISTGCLAGDVAGADRKLQDYLVGKHKPDFRKGDPEKVAVADVLLYYVQEHAPSVARPELIGIHMLPLAQFFGAKMCSEVDPKSCRDYVKKRVAGAIGRRMVKATTARRELETFQAALNFAHAERKLLFPIKLAYPDKGPPRERWLERWEVAALLLGALGFVAIAFDIQTRRPIKWEREKGKVRHYHVARFILLGLYTGTRHDAILNLRWFRNSDGGWIDLNRRLIFRRGDGQVETSKRRSPVNFPRRLKAHLERWRKDTTHGPIEYHGQLIAKMKTGFNNARDRAGFAGDVVPHVLRHTCATWKLNDGETVWDVAGYLGTSDKVINATYGHHVIAEEIAARNGFLGRKMGLGQSERKIQ